MTTPSTTPVTDDVELPWSPVMLPWSAEKVLAVELLCPTCKRRLGFDTLVGDTFLTLPGRELYVVRIVLRPRWDPITDRRLGRLYKGTFPTVWTCRNGHRLSLDRDHLLGLLNAVGRDGTSQSYLRASPSVIA